jgi:hypothetical protein
MAQRLGQGDHTLVIGVSENDCAVVRDEVHDRGNLAARDITRCFDDVECFVQNDELPFLELSLFGRLKMP